MAAPLLKRRRILACKAETTPGTAEALTAAEAAFIAYDAMLQQSAEMEERLAQGSFNRHPSHVSRRMGRMTFKSHFIASSATPAGWASWLAGCGLGYNTSYYQASPLAPDGAGSATDSLTFGLYTDGKLKQIHGAMGNGVLNLPAGRVGFAEWDFQGIWDAPTDVALLVPTYPSVAPMRVVSSALALGAYGDFKVGNIRIDIGNVLYPREDVDAASGIYFVCVSDRLTKITIDPEAGLVATKDVYGEWLAGTEADLTCVLSNGSYKCTITVSDVQIINPQEADRSGVEVDSLECQANTDDLKLTFASA